jgi:flagella basal body P-ring formation protein FlgA
MIRILGALALLPVLAGPALAQPTLRAEALVSGEIVTVGDLIDGAHGLEGVALFRAPDPGQTGPLPAAAAIAAARRAGVSDVSANGVREVFVTRASREITTSQMAGMITARAATEFGCDVEAVETTLDASVTTVHLDAELTGALEVSRFAADPKTGRFDATLSVAGTSRAAPIRVTGTAVETVEVATLSRALARGDIVSAADVRSDRRPKAQAQDALRPTEVAGLAAKRALREDQPLRPGDLMRPQHVERGAFITLIYATSGVSLSLKAKALGAGAAGDLVAVQNIQSKRVVNGVVTGPSEVTVTAAPTALARR